MTIGIKIYRHRSIHPINNIPQIEAQTGIRLLTKY